MKTEVAAALAEYSRSLDDKWRPMTVSLEGRRYWARRLDSADLADVSPFRLLAEGIEGAKVEMGLWSLAAVGASFSGQPGFVLLADHTDAAGGGHAEDLQDHDCAIARPHS
jgi:CDP-diacylglycerol pyrophosphatase